VSTTTPIKRNKLKELKQAYTPPVPQSNSIAGGPLLSTVLSERGARYGKFSKHAEITQTLKRVMHSTPNWTLLSSAQKESLEMIAHKIGRILNGDPNYSDSWVDIAGYSKLVADLCEGVDN